MPTVKLTQGQSYRAIVRVDVPRLVVSRAAVQRRFEELGFTNVIAWLDPRDLPPDWGARRPGELPEGWPAFVQGKWDRASVELDAPDAVIASWSFQPTTSSSSASWTGAPNGPDLGESILLVTKLILLRVGTQLAREALSEVFE